VGRTRAALVIALAALGASFAVWGVACVFGVPGLLPRDAGDADTDIAVDVPLDTALEDAGAMVEAGPHGCPEGMVRTATFCIDATEVTGKAYFPFMRAATASGRKSSHPRCSWLVTWQPGTTGVPPSEDDLPVVNINWCQAYEYCMSLGKRLCGQLGGGGPVAPDQRNQPDHDEWYIACAGGIGQTYCYGSTFQDGACNVHTTGSERVASRPSCWGAFPGLFDMGGNVAEWFDACDGDDTDAGTDNSNCGIRLGMYLTEGNGADVESRCISVDATGRTTEQPYIGFRCCATPAP
jgi:formylglycine-generating enzyme required for sulfatase activity